MTTTLPRMKFSQPSADLRDARVELATRADKVLGYKHLAQSIAAPGALLYTLHGLGIEPLIRSSVEAYKREKARPGMWSGTKLAVRLWITAVIPLLSFLTLAYLWHAGTDFTPDPGIFLGTFGSVVATVILLISGVVNAGGGERAVRDWVTFDLKGYKGTIPEFVLQKALLVAEHCPGTTFSVEQLRETIQDKVLLPDPFLLVRYDGELYYLDVWEEKEYEVTL